MYTVPGSAPSILQDQTEMDRVLPPVTTFVDPIVGQSPSSYRELLEAQMEAEVTEVEGRMREMETRGVRTGYENRNYDGWTNDDNQRYQQQHHHQTYLPSSSPVNGQWPDVVPNDLQPSSLLQGHHGVVMSNYPLTYNNGMNDSQQWDYQRTANNQLLLTNSGLNANMDVGGGLVHHVPPNIINVPPQRVVVGRAPSTRRCRGHRGGRQREKTPPFESDNERRQWEKERRKKDIHNKIEQRRRYNINDRIDDLGILLRKGGHDIRQNKGAILRETISYIRDLRTYLSGREKMEEKAEEMNRTNEAFSLRIQRMHSFLQSKGYQLSNELYSRTTTGPSVQDHQEWTSPDQLQVYTTMKETPQRGNAVAAPYPEAPVVKQEESSGNLTPLYAPIGAAGVQGGEGLHSVCEQAPPAGYYQMHGQYQY